MTRRRLPRPPAYPVDVWTPAPLEPIPLLTELRAFVLARSQTRFPLCHFWMADGWPRISRCGSSPG
jgi:hypothetical protein